MKKRTLLSSVLLLAVVGIGVTILYQERHTSSIRTEQKRITEIGDIHSDILRMIVTKKETIFKITPEMATTELENRAGKVLEFDKKPMDVKALPFDIVKAIAKSPTTIAGITPKMAINEIIKRYSSIDLSDSDDVDSTILLEALQHRGEQKAIDDWAKNEDNEAIEAFMKEEADRDPSSIANFIYGLKNLEKNHDMAVNYMDRYANNIHDDTFDNKDEAKANDILIKAIQDLKGKSKNS